MPERKSKRTECFAKIIVLDDETGLCSLSIDRSTYLDRFSSFPSFFLTLLNPKRCQRRKSSRCINLD